MTIRYALQHKTCGHRLAARRGTRVQLGNVIIGGFT